MKDTGMKQKPRAKTTTTETKCGRRTCRDRPMRLKVPIDRSRFFLSPLYPQRKYNECRMGKENGRERTCGFTNLLPWIPWPQNNTPQTYEKRVRVVCVRNAIKEEDDPKKKKKTGFYTCCNRIAADCSAAYHSSSWPGFQSSELLDCKSQKRWVRERETMKNNNTVNWVPLGWLFNNRRRRENLLGIGLAGRTVLDRMVRLAVAFKADFPLWHAGTPTGSVKFFMFRTRELSKARVHKLPNTASRRRRVCRGAAFAVTGIDVVRGGIPSLDTSVRGQQDILVVNHQMMSRRGHCCRRRIRRVHHQGHGQLAPINQRPAPFLIATTTQMRIQVDPLRSNFSNQSAQMLLLLISHRGEEKR